LLINLKQKIDEEPLQDLLGYAVFPDHDRLQQVIHDYKTNPKLELFGCKLEQHVIGVIGFTLLKESIIEIKHIAVDPEFRGCGYGRGMILELLEMKSPSIIQAETDEDAVDFYRNVGFAITSLGEQFPGVERFSCIYEVVLIDENKL